MYGRVNFADLQVDPWGIGAKRENRPTNRNILPFVNRTLIMLNVNDYRNSLRKYNQCSPIVEGGEGGEEPALLFLFFFRTPIIFLCFLPRREGDAATRNLCPK